MRKIGKGILLAGTLSSALMAICLAGCGEQTNVIPSSNQSSVTAAALKASSDQPKAQTVQAAAPEITEPYVSKDDYSGSYFEEIAGRGNMIITKNDDGTYSVHVSWASSAFETNSWDFTGTFDETGVLYYTDCRMTTETFDDDGKYTYDSRGIMTPSTNYTAGSGYIAFDGKGIVWNDDMGDIAPGYRFVAHEV